MYFRKTEFFLLLSSCLVLDLSCAQMTEFGPGSRSFTRCSDSSECEKGLECKDTVCLEIPTVTEMCNPAVSVHIPLIEKKDGGTCGGILGKPCVGGLCGIGLTCDVSDRCSCQVGLEEFNGTCYGTHNSKCTGEGPDKCGPEFNCIDGKCKCKQPEVQILVNTAGHVLKKCISKVLGPCENDMSCVSNAECRTVDTVKQCRCKPDYVNVDGFCDMAYKAPCENNSLDPPSPLLYSNADGTDGSFSSSCDRVAGLKCVNEVCDCEDAGSIFDPEVRKCKRLAGSTCTQDNCIKHGTCLNTPYLPPMCRCDKNFGIDKDRTCRRNLRPQMELSGALYETCKRLVCEYAHKTR